MDQAPSRLDKLKKLERGLRAAGIAAILLGVMGAFASVGFFFLRWYYILGGTIDVERYNAMIDALKLLTLVFFPLVAIFYLAIGVHVLYFLKTHKNLMKDDHDA